MLACSMYSQKQKVQSTRDPETYILKEWGRSRMSSLDDRSHRLASSWPEAHELAPFTESLAPEEHITGTQPSALIPLPGQAVFQTSQHLPAVTRSLEAQTASRRAVAAPGVSLHTSQRLPVVIKSDLKRRPAPAAPLPRRRRTLRRLLTHVIGVVLLLLVTALTLLSVTPLGHDIGVTFNPLQSGSNLLTQSQNPSLNSLVAQATATAVYHRQTDGFDPNATSGQTVGNGLGSLNWPIGQCTYWANSRYHALTGHWVPWNGNADQWVAGARSAGWSVSQIPHVPSIIVLMPGVQGASSYGHVAVVEHLVTGATPTTVYTSNMNWYANGGGWDKISYVNFTVGSGVYFVWHV
jgi:surface antigen